jgi:acyl carrier protein
VNGMGFSLSAEQREHESESSGGGRRDSASEHTQRKGAQVETVINDYISREFIRDPALLPLADDTSLLDSGILDSLSFLRLVVFLEQRFGCTMGDADLLRENFASVNAICAYLRTRAPGDLEEAAARG